MLFSQCCLLAILAIGKFAFGAVLIERASTSSRKSSSISTYTSSLSSSVSTSDTSSNPVSAATQAPDKSCTNTAFTRQCWGNGFSIATDYDTSWPVTGKTIHYNFEITNTTMALDGVSRMVLAVNGQYPGPTVYATWGDTISVTVKNSLQNNGTGIHWYGIRQMNSGQMDGTSGITECPIPPGATKTYTFLATQFGTSWYHSHYSSQYGDGIVGPIVIYGPATSNYDIDLGAMPITDWYYKTAFALNEITLHTPGPPPAADTALINGTMVSSSGGSYNKVTLTRGKKYRLRLINTSSDNNFRVSLDSHNLTVVQADFVPTKPYTAQFIFIAIGQRYDIIVYADQNVDNYWFRVDVVSGCGSTNGNNGNIKSIFSYAGAPNSNPTSTGPTAPQDCNEEKGIIPYVVKNVPSTTFASEYQELGVQLNTGVASNGQSIIQWTLDGAAINTSWSDPTLKYVSDKSDNFPNAFNVLKLPNANQLYFWVFKSIAGSASAPHPIHLHGHDFYLLGSGSGDFSDPSTLQWNNPPRRDVAMLPAGGYLVIGFPADNPGAWLMHCHIAWHVAQGLAVQFLERESEIANTFNLNNIKPECQVYDAYYKNAIYVKDDSGL